MFVYSAHIVSVYDGDTITADVDLGFYAHLKGLKCRLAGIDAPELRGDSLIAGRASRDYLREMILGKDVVIKTQKDKTGKYGRWIADIYIGNIHVNADLVNAGHAVFREY